MLCSDRLRRLPDEAFLTDNRRDLIAPHPHRVRASLRLSLLDQAPISKGGTGADGADELMIVSITFEHAARRRSYELIADAFGLMRQSREPAALASA